MTGEDSLAGKNKFRVGKGLKTAGTDILLLQLPIIQTWDSSSLYLQVLCGNIQKVSAPTEISAGALLGETQKPPGSK
jgi:hypothetical protein